MKHVPRLCSLFLASLVPFAAVANEVPADVVALRDAEASLIEAYLAEESIATIESIRVDLSEIRVSGRLAEIDKPPYHLAEVRPHEVPWHPGPFVPSGDTQLIEVDSDGAFQVVLPRENHDRDRITSRWCVLNGEGERISAAVYPTDISEASTQELQVRTNPSLKGLGGISDHPLLSDLVELGVGHITVNFWVSGLLASEHGPDTENFSYEGETFYFSKRALQSYDRVLTFAAENHMVASAIILIGFEGRSPIAARMAHPEANREGHYPMPNFTSEEGVRTYGAVLEFLAKRYATPGDDTPRITNWILQNEVDYGWDWTNMGEQPMPRFLETYVRSMRLCYYLARKYHPGARVFISMTHHWDYEPANPRRSYSGRAMIEMLQRFADKEGDFNYGIAFHPYPQNLFKADTWNDGTATFSFDTHRITMKNIEVLDAYLRQDHLRDSEGNLRSVILSEQGFHTDADYNETTQRIQGAALAYTWHKLRTLDSIEAFHHHRWIDHPKEGGLMLGLRTLPTEEHPHGQKKLGWKVFQSLETPNEATETSFAKEVIGIESFEEIPYRGEIQE